MVQWLVHKQNLVYMNETAQEVNTLGWRQNAQDLADDIFKCIIFSKNAWISIEFSLKFVLKGLINNIPPLVQIMAWHWPGDKPLSEPMMVSLLMHICVSQPWWVKMVLDKFSVHLKKLLVLLWRYIENKHVIKGKSCRISRSLQKMVSLSSGTGMNFEHCFYFATTCRYSSPWYCLLESSWIPW